MMTFFYLHAFRKKFCVALKKTTIVIFFFTYFKFLLLLIEFAIFILKKLKNYLTSYYKNFQFTLTENLSVLKRYRDHY